MKTRTKLLLGSVALEAALGVRALARGSRAFDRLVGEDVEKLLAQVQDVPEIIASEEMLDGLPEPAARYLRHTGVVGKPIPPTVHLKQIGTMRLGLGQPTIPLAAEQWYTTQPPGFVWDGSMRLGPLPVAHGRDIYANGMGNMLIKVASLFTVVDAAGKEMDQGAMMRYLSEMIWFPSAFLLGNISFEAVDANSARVTLTDRGRSATGTLYVDEEGRLTAFKARRYRMVGKRYELADWTTPVTKYGTFKGLRLPVRGKAVWNLPEGDLEYIDATITEVEYTGGRTWHSSSMSAGRSATAASPSSTKPPRSGAAIEQSAAGRSLASSSGSREP